MSFKFRAKHSYFTYRNSDFACRIQSVRLDMGRKVKKLVDKLENFIGQVVYGRGSRIPQRATHQEDAERIVHGKDSGDFWLFEVSIVSIRTDQRFLEDQETFYRYDYTQADKILEKRV